MIDKLEVFNFRKFQSMNVNPLNRSMIIYWSNNCDLGKKLILTDFDLQIQHKNGTFLKVNLSKLLCEFSDSIYECQTNMSTLRSDFGLRSRNDSLTIRVKRTNSVDNWFYNSLSERSDQISSEPDPPVFPPQKSIFSNKTCLLLNLYKNTGP